MASSQVERRGSGRNWSYDTTWFIVKGCSGSSHQSKCHGHFKVMVRVVIDVWGQQQPASTSHQLIHIANPQRHWLPVGLKRREVQAGCWVPAWPGGLVGLPSLTAAKTTDWGLSSMTSWLKMANLANFSTLLTNLTFSLLVNFIKLLKNLKWGYHMVDRDMFGNRYQVDIQQSIHWLLACLLAS